MTTTRNTNTPAAGRSRPVVVAVAVAITAIAGSEPASSNRARATQQKPTIVLVHGGWADSSGWNSQVSALQRRGYPVIAPANRSVASPLTPRTCAASSRRSRGRSCSSAIPTAAP